MKIRTVGAGEWNLQRRPESFASWKLRSLSPAQFAGVAPVSPCAAALPPHLEDTSEF